MTGTQYYHITILDVELWIKQVDNTIDYLRCLVDHPSVVMEN